MTKVALTKTLAGTLAAVDPEGEEFLARLKPGAVVRADWKRARNPARFRKFWALVKICQDNTDTTLSKEAWADYLKILAGHVETIRRRRKYHEEVIQLPKSIAFGKIGESEFSAFLDRLINAICTEVIPGLPEGDLRRELEQITGLRTEPLATVTGAVPSEEEK